MSSLRSVTPWYAALMTPGMLPVTLAAGDHGLVSDTVGLFTALLGFAATVGILTKFVRTTSRRTTHDH